MNKKYFIIIVVLCCIFAMSLYYNYSYYEGMDASGSILDSSRNVVDSSRNGVDNCTLVSKLILNHKKTPNNTYQSNQILDVLGKCSQSIITNVNIMQSELTSNNSNANITQQQLQQMQSELTAYNSTQQTQYA